MRSARRLMVFNVCVKFHENMSSDFKLMERTRKLLTDTHTCTHMCRGYNNRALDNREYLMIIFLISH